LSNLTNENDIQFVGEEWGLEKETIAHAVAEEKGGILWENINTSHEDLDTLGIPLDYMNGHTPQRKWRNGTVNVRMQ
jgi:hypothetical protein